MLYAKNIKALPQVLADLGLLAVIGVMIFISMKVRDLVNLIAVPAQKAVDAANAMSGTMGMAGASVTQAGLDMSGTWSTAADQVSNVALVGPLLSAPFNATAAGINGAFDAIATPFTSVSSSMNDLAETLQQFISIVNVCAIIVAVIVFLVPVVWYMWKWLPWRFAFVRRATAGQRLLRADSAPELFALRALASAPMYELLKITPDPMGAWKAGNTEVIARLANLNLGEHGLKLPKSA